MKYIPWIGLGLLLVYEIWALKSDAPGDTISEVIWRVSKRPLLPFAFGILMGHFFW